MKKASTAVVVFGLLVSGCVSNGNTLGFGATGAAGGAAVGQMFGKGQGRLLATAGGTALGGLIGAFIGNKFDTINSNQASIVGIQQQQYQQMRSSNDGSRVIIHNQQHHHRGYAVEMDCRVIRNQVICGSQ